MGIGIPREFSGNGNGRRIGLAEMGISVAEMGITLIPIGINLRSPQELQL